MNARNRIGSFVIEVRPMSGDWHLVSITNDAEKDPSKRCIKCAEYEGAECAMKAYDEYCKDAQVMAEERASQNGEFVPRWIVWYEEDETGIGNEVFETYKEALAYYEKIDAWLNPSIERFKGVFA